MPITFVSSNSSVIGVGATCVITAPASMSTGDFMLALVLARTGIENSISAPDANWATYVQSTYVGTTGVSSIWSKTATADDVTAAGFSFSVSTGTNRGVLVAFRGQTDTGSFRDETVLANAATTQAAYTAAASHTSGGAVIFAACNRIATVFSSHSLSGESVTFTQIVSGLSGSGMSFDVAWGTTTLNGNLGTGLATLSATARVNAYMALLSTTGAGATVFIRVGMLKGLG